MLIIGTNFLDRVCILQNMGPTESEPYPCSTIPRMVKKRIIHCIHVWSKEELIGRSKFQLYGLETVYSAVVAALGRKGLFFFISFFFNKEGGGRLARHCRNSVLLECRLLHVNDDNVIIRCEVRNNGIFALEQYHDVVSRTSACKNDGRLLGVFALSSIRSARWVILFLFMQRIRTIDRHGARRRSKHLLCHGIEDASICISNNEIVTGSRGLVFVVLTTLYGSRQRWINHGLWCGPVEFYFTKLVSGFT